VFRAPLIAAPNRWRYCLSASCANLDGPRFLIGALIALALMAELVALTAWVLA
jgi:hypothetical protein